MVSTFLSMGKGHRAMQTFCVGMGMKGMSQSAFSKHVDILHIQNASVNAEVLKRLIMLLDRHILTVTQL